MHPINLKALFLILLLACVFFPGSGLAQSRLLSSAGVVGNESGPEKKDDNLKIVSLSPVITEMLFAIDAGSMVKAVTRWCDEPQEARKLPKVGDISINLESLMMHSPDLILTMAGLRRDQLKRIQTLGMRVESLQIDRVDHIIPALKQMGELVNRQEKAHEVCADLEICLNWAAKKISDVKRPPRVYIEIFGNPVMTAGSQSFLNDLVVLAGGTNVFGDVKRNYFSVSNEEVLLKMPEKVLICYPAEDKKEFSSRPGYSALPAVRGNNIHFVPINIYVRPGPRIGRALVDLVKRIHPEKFGFGKDNGPFAENMNKMTKKEDSSIKSRHPEKLDCHEK